MDLTALIAVRMRHVENLLGQALRVEIARYLSSQIEDRVRELHAWATRTSKVAFEEMRRQTDLRAEELVGAIAAQVNEVRSMLGPGSDAVADQRIMLTAVAPRLENAASELLRELSVPGDGASDFTPSEAFLWAWRHARMMDVARLAWEEHGHGTVPPSLEIRLFLPESMGDD